MEDEHSSGTARYPGRNFLSPYIELSLSDSLGCWPLHGLRLAAPLERIST